MFKNKKMHGKEMLRMMIWMALGFTCFSIKAMGQEEWKMQEIDIPTRWAKAVSPSNVLPEYPRPQMVRMKWSNLNGIWQYAITSNKVKKPSKFDGNILVPYPLESALSGVMKILLPEQLLWYRRSFDLPAVQKGERTLLHFGAVDWQSTVFVNEKKIGGHTGGYQNFSLDITDALKTGVNELVVKVYDPSDKGIGPHGKQLLYASGTGTSYTPVSGIWQTVWMETVPAVSIESLKMTPDLDGEKLDLTITAGRGAEPEIVVYDSISKKEISRQFASLEMMAEGYKGTIQIPNAKLWSPDDPFLYGLVVRLKRDGKVVDEVKTYFGMRKIEVKKDDKGIERIFLNNKYTYSLGVLDQGYWPDGLYTAPTDEALAFDIKAAKAMGFNTIRKHIKIEPARWYYHCDKLGMLVWQDLVNPNMGLPEGSKEEFEKESQESLAQLHNYPSITTWVLFNEGWGAYDQARLTKWVKNADSSRPVNGHSGENLYNASPEQDSLKWANSDITDIHHYPEPQMPAYLPGKARVLGEFGGIGAFPIEGHTWNDVVKGYSYVRIEASAMISEYRKLTNSLKKLEAEGLTGSIYTQPYDVEGEHNGLMTYDREIIKLPLARLREINAMLIPVTKNYLTATDSFSALVLDTVNIDNEYPVRLAEYKKGRRDSLFLRRLALMASRLKDNTYATKISAEYIAQIKSPFVPNNLRFIKLFTKSSTDPGFEILLKNQKIADRLFGQGQTEKILKIVIFNQELKKYAMDKQAKPNWNLIGKDIITKYGKLGEEMVWYAHAKHSLFTKDLGMTFKMVKKLIQKYGNNVSSADLNAYAWGMFEHSSDKKNLAEALSWSKRSMELDNKPGYKDTYANLLYKLGYVKEAISWQEKAVSKLPHDIEILNNLEKMKKGEATWIRTN